jgi:alkanesulfonate monooxygenase SsuD/methylene tetrahydromethanopterin reductase-like flavin-dependent oxidoreductase (luciferase family)
MRRAVRIADGFFGAGSQTTAAFSEQVKIVLAELAERGRDPSTFAIAKRVYVHVDDDAARARERTVAALDYHYGRGGLEAVAVAGPPATCVAGLREVADAGAEMILLNTLLDDAEQMERLAAEVMPELS